MTTRQEYLALPLTPLLSLHISPAPLGVGGGAEGTHMTGHATSKGRDNAALDAVATLQGRHNPALAVFVGQADQLLSEPLKLFLLDANVPAWRWGDMALVNGGGRVLVVRMCKADCGILHCERGQNTPLNPETNHFGFLCTACMWGQACVPFCARRACRQEQPCTVTHKDRRLSISQHEHHTHMHSPVRRQTEGSIKNIADKTSCVTLAVRASSMSHLHLPNRHHQPDPDAVPASDQNFCAADNNLT